MSGPDAADGDAVVVLFVGYRLRGNILLTAMVSHKGAAAGEGPHFEQDAAGMIGRGNRMQATAP